MWATVRFGHPQVHQQLLDDFAGHRAAPIRMEAELTRRDLLRQAGLQDELLGKLCAFSGCDAPPDDVTAEDVDDYIQIEVGPLARRLELGDVPAPDLIWPCGQQFRLRISRMAQLVAPLLDLLVALQQPVHARDRAVID